LKISKQLFIPVIALFGMACELEREVEVILPPFEKQLVAECYLTRSEGFQMLLTETDPYFDTLRFPFVNNARIRIKQGDLEDTLAFFPFLDLENRKFYNYTRSVEGFDRDLDIEMEIVDSLGRTLKGRTRFLPEPQVDSIEVRYGDGPDSLAGFRIWIQDFPGASNYYRIIMNQDSLSGPPVLQFTFSDNGLDGKRFPLGTSNRFQREKDMYIRIFHIDKAYYDYLEAMEDAARANGNPFAQPSTISSPMEGKGYGIFTTLNFTTFLRKT
jgi:hypothetical protein